MTWNVIFFQIYIVIFALWTFQTFNFDFTKVVSIFTKVDLFLCSLSSMLKISRLHSNLTLISETKSGSNFLRKCQIIQINFWRSTHNAKGQEALFWFNWDLAVLAFSLNSSSDRQRDHSFSLGHHGLIDIIHSILSILRSLRRLLSGHNFVNHTDRH